MDTGTLTKLASELRYDVIEMIGAAGSGHPGGSLSCIDILTALYFGEVMHYDPADPDLADRDQFILAKGHAAPALYAVLAHAGYFPKDELIRLRKLGSILQGHPDSNRVPGVEVSTGSLGQGLSISCGIAAGHMIHGIDATVFTLLGDGECEEGQVWEAAMFANHYSLDNLVAIIDHNGLQIDGKITDVCNPEDLCAKFLAFGWEVTQVDGHDIAALVETFQKLKGERNGKPHMVIAHTVKGKGVSYMENQVSWHGKAPKGEELAQALEELDAARKEAVRG